MACAAPRRGPPPRLPTSLTGDMWAPPLPGLLAEGPRRVAPPCLPRRRHASPQPTPLCLPRWRSSNPRQGAREEKWRPRQGSRRAKHLLSCTAPFLLSAGEPSTHSLPPPSTHRSLPPPPASPEPPPASSTSRRAECSSVLHSASESSTCPPLGAERRP
jgi:hypothetical protein